MKRYQRSAGSFHMFLPCILLLCLQLVTSQETSPCPTTRERKRWDDLSCTEQDDFLSAVRRLKDNGIYDFFVITHIRRDRPAHGTPEFLPWHRWFIYQFESAIQSVADDPCITLPYWDWEKDSGREARSSVFDVDTFGAFSRSCNWPTSSGGCLQWDFNSDFQFWSERRIVGMIANYRQYGDDFPDDEDRNNGFRAELEGGPHAAPHNFMGGPMIDLRSPEDPLFWLHHANVDRLYAIWQDYYGHSTLSDDAYTVPEHYEGSLLDRSMPYRNNGLWDFSYNGRATPPTPRDVLSNSGAVIRVRYIQDSIMPGYTPNRQWFASRGLFHNGCRQRRRHRRGRELSPTNEEVIDDNDNLNTQPRKQLKNRKHFLRHREDTMISPHDIESPQEQAASSTTTTTSLSSSSTCQSMNAFHKSTDRQRWNELCELYIDKYTDNDTNDTSTTTISSFIPQITALMAIEECEELNNPKSASDVYIQLMNMTNEKVTFDCFHLPD